MARCTRTWRRPAGERQPVAPAIASRGPRQSSRAGAPLAAGVAGYRHGLFIGDRDAEHRQQRDRRSDEHLQGHGHRHPGGAVPVRPAGADADAGVARHRTAAPRRGRSGAPGGAGPVLGAGDLSRTHQQRQYRRRQRRARGRRQAAAARRTFPLALRRSRHLRGGGRDNRRGPGGARRSAAPRRATDGQRLSVSRDRHSPAAGQRRSLAVRRQRLAVRAGAGHAAPAAGRRGQPRGGAGLAGSGRL
ncbi:Uncharacterised protein [Klebsiella pneumoniae]|nr:Uncharacterised protein [Klebsiella pneumoniae]